MPERVDGWCWVDIVRQCVPDLRDCGSRKDRRITHSPSTANLDYSQILLNCHHGRSIASTSYSSSSRFPLQHFLVIMYSCLHGQAPRYLTDLCIPVSDVLVRQHIRSATRRFFWRLAMPAQHTRSTGLLCGRPVALELSTRQPDRSGSWQGQLQTSAEDAFIYTVYWSI